jgi:tRNA pseudouridine55 synthase
MKRKVDGVLLLDKPAGLTSNTALQKAKRLFRAEKAGHTGTLDPFATGLLPLCLGEATKFSQFLLDADKAYLAEVKFGVRTSSGDLDGEVIATRPVDLVAPQVRRALEGFLGDIEQVPPMHSALKHQGRPLYEYARKGIEIERPARRVVVHSLELESFTGDACVLRVHCGKGFYVRALADDLGEVLGCGAHLSGLRRTAVGRFDIADAVTPAQLEAFLEPERDARLLPADALITELPDLALDPESAWQISHGQAVWLPRLRVGAVHRIYAPDGRFLGVAAVDEDGKLAPRRLIATA